MKDASCFLWVRGAGGLLSCSPRVAVRPGGEFIAGLPGLVRVDQRRCEISVAVLVVEAVAWRLLAAE